MEQFENLLGSITSSVPIPTNVASLTLAAPYTAGSGSITLSSGAGLPASGTFSLTILNAKTGAVYLIFRVTSVAGAVCSGAAEGTDANAPTGAAVIGTVLSSAALQQIKEDTLFNGDLSAFGPSAQSWPDETTYESLIQFGLTSTVGTFAYRASQGGQISQSFFTDEGTLSTPTVSLNEDGILLQQFFGASDDTPSIAIEAAAFNVFVDGNPASGFVPGAMLWTVKGTAHTFGFALRSSGNLDLNAPFGIGKSQLLNSSFTFATLPTPTNGMQVYCSDGKVTNPTDNTLIAGGSGAMAFFINGVWKALQ
jgi:hypothetical protein